MNQDLNSKNQEKKTIDIFPLGKWKRILVYICDFFLCVFAGFIIMNVAAFPIGSASSNFKGRAEISETATHNRDDILFSHQVLFTDQDFDRYNYNQSLKFTSLCFTKTYVSEVEGIDAIYNYFVGIYNDMDRYLLVLKEVDKPYGFFDFSSGEAVLKEEFKTEFLPAVDDKDAFTPQGQKHFATFNEKIFLRAYQAIYDDLEVNDLCLKTATGIDESVSYQEQTQIIASYNHYYQMLVVCSSYISMVLAGLILFLVIPLCNKNGKTIAMLMMRVERVGMNNIFLLKKGDVALTSVYQIVACFGALLFIPFPAVDVVTAFSLGAISIVAIVAIVIVAISGIVLMFTHFNQTLFDVLSRTVMISSDSLDEIYREKGYFI